MAKAKKAGIIPVREEWDFNSCPPEWANYCCTVEFDRERNIRARELGEVVSDKQIGLPYLLRPTAIGMHQMTDADWKASYDSPPGDEHLMTAIFNGSAEMLAKGATFGRADLHVLGVDWNRSDKVLLKAFAWWLKDNRQRPATYQRGISEARVALALLKALGAYRLLKVFTAEDAITHTGKVAGAALYSKRPDWYEAKARVEKELERKTSRPVARGASTR